MKTVGEWIDKVNEIGNSLEHDANIELQEKIHKAKAYHEGYVQACEDFVREMSSAISQNQG